MKSQEEEISKERWEEAMSTVLQSPHPGNPLMVRIDPGELSGSPDLAKKIAGATELRGSALMPISKAMMPAHTSSPSLLSDLWACLLLLPRLMRWAIAEAAKISRELGDRQLPNGSIGGGKW